MSKSASKGKSETSTSSKNTVKNAPEFESADAGNMNKIRDILFGNQVRDFDRRFSSLEEHINGTLKDMREDTRKNLDAIERYFKEELQELSDRIRNEGSQRSENLQTLNEEMKNSAATLSQKITDTNDSLAERAGELRRLLLDQSKQLTAEIQEKYDQSKAELKQTATRLESSKVERTAMAELLIQMAMSLSDTPNGETEQSQSPG